MPEPMCVIKENNEELAKGKPHKPNLRGNLLFLVQVSQVAILLSNVGVKCDL